MRFLKWLAVLLAIVLSIETFGQGRISWMKDGTAYTRIEAGEIVKYILPANTKSVLVAREKLIPMVYVELRRLARSYLRRERTEHTLQATALVHEACSGRRTGKAGRNFLALPRR